MSQLKRCTVISANIGPMLQCHLSQFAPLAAVFLGIPPFKNSTIFDNKKPKPIFYPKSIRVICHSVTCHLSYKSNSMSFIPRGDSSRQKNENKCCKFVPREFVSPTFLLDRYCRSGVKWDPLRHFFSILTFLLSPNHKKREKNFLSEIKNEESDFR